MFGLGFDSLQRVADKVNAAPIESRPVSQGRIDDSWPRFHPAIVTTAITSATVASDVITCGTGVVRILRALQQSTPTELALESIPSNAHPDLIEVYRPDVSGVSIPVGMIGYVTEDGWGTMYWIPIQPVIHFLFTLTEDLTYSAATANLRDMTDTIPIKTDLVRDPLGIFAGLSSGSRGICVLQDSKFYILQAECD
jgi:hypothetical protein